MSLEWMREAMIRAGQATAIIEGERTQSYAGLVAAIDGLRERLRGWGLRRGDVLAFAGDYSEAGVTRFFAALLEGLVAVPLATGVQAELDAALTAVPADAFFPATPELDQPPRRCLPAGQRSSHPLLDELRGRDHAGLIILTSGSTGRPKVILHDAEVLLGKFRAERRPHRALVFLLPDHMGGVNTLFGMLTSGSTIILPTTREPDAICALIERHRAELLPVTPSFLNLLLVSEAWRRHDLSSLRTISYGTEVMPQPTLQRAVQVFPGVRFVQLYGTSELGIFRGGSRANDSPFLALKGDGFAEFRVAGGTLRVRGANSMLGYLGPEPSGFDADGWYDTGDLVEEQDGYVRFLGRASELINVGGQKVLPGEVEAALLALPGVEDASVHGEANVLTGQAVVARVRLSTGEDARTFKQRMRKALQGRIEPFKIPVRVTLADVLVSPRFKKLRGERTAG